VKLLFVKDAFAKLKNNKVPGDDGITALMLKNGGEILVNKFHELVLSVWHSETIQTIVETMAYIVLDFRFQKK
jgi:hypothetical protein